MTSLSLSAGRTVPVIVVHVDILRISAIEQNIVFEAVVRIHEDQWQFTCHLIWR